MSRNSTIVATATPTGHGGIGMVRLSGPEAIAIGRQIFHSDNRLGDRLRHVEVGRVLNASCHEIDSALAWAFRAPASYTGEDTVEITTHGSVVVLESVVDAAIARGATLAQPGEFTRRAFVNGNIDLVQAEAVVDLIQCQSRGSMYAAYVASSGRLSNEVHQIKARIVQALSWIEIGLDFTDEDIDPVHQRATLELLTEAAVHLDRLVATFESTRRRQEGFCVVLLGRPNAGKSTLLNALVGADRAIVASTPGTTRDTVEARAIWHGETVRLIDTAGIRTDDVGPVEREGMERSWRAASGADCAVVVLDGSKPWSQDDAMLLSRLNGTPTIVAMNKCDLPSVMRVPSQMLGARQLFQVSALDGTGLNQLRESAAEQLLTTIAPLDIGLLRQRHHDLLNRARVGIDEAAKSISEEGLPECASATLREALEAVGAVLGENVDEEVLDQIFSEFCIGK